PDGSRIHYERVSEKTGRAVDYDKIRRGFETSRGKYVAFEAGELERLQPASTKTIDIEDFVSLDEIDPIYYERTYFLTPDGEAAAKGYSLLASVMTDRQRIDRQGRHARQAVSGRDPTLRFGLGVVDDALRRRGGRSIAVGRDARAQDSGQRTGEGDGHADRRLDVAPLGSRSLPRRLREAAAQHH